MICPKCGKETGESKFCPECGTKMVEEIQTEATNNEDTEKVLVGTNDDITTQNNGIDVPDLSLAQQKAKKPIYKRVLFWIIVILVILVTVVIVSSVIPKSATKNNTQTESTSSSKTVKVERAIDNSKQEICVECETINDLIVEKATKFGKMNYSWTPTEENGKYGLKINDIDAGVYVYYFIDGKRVSENIVPDTIMIKNDSKVEDVKFFLYADMALVAITDPFISENEMSDSVKLVQSLSNGLEKDNRSIPLVTYEQAFIKYSYTNIKEDNVYALWASTKKDDTFYLYS